MVSQLNKLLVLMLLAVPAIAQETTTEIEPIITESTVTSNTSTTLKSPPPSAISPTINTSNSDLCTFGVAGAIQTQILGVSTGTQVTDDNCEMLKNAKKISHVRHCLDIFHIFDLSKLISNSGPSF